jgi:hypothetical protein
VARGERDCTTWHRKLDFLKRNHGMALMVTHPDYLNTDRFQKLYREFLTAVRDGGGYWHALPWEVAAWWRSREQAENDRQPRYAHIAVKDGAIAFNEETKITST